MEIYEFRAAYPEFSAEADTTIQINLDLFVIIYGTGYGSLVDHMQGLYTAHKLTLNNQSQDTTGQIISKTVGDVSVTYANTEKSIAGGASLLHSTRYGKELAQLISGFSNAVVANV